MSHFLGRYKYLYKKWDSLSSQDIFFAVAIATMVLLNVASGLFLEKEYFVSLLSSSTLLLIAFVAYPWQKRRDRDLKIQEEKRKLYADFVSSVHNYAVVVSDKDSVFSSRRTANQECIIRLRVFRIYEDDTVFNLAKLYKSAVDEMRSGIWAPDEETEQWERKVRESGEPVNAALEGLLESMERRIKNLK